MKLKCDFLAPGHVGSPLPCNDIKLVDVAEMNYFAANGEGEVSLWHSNDMYRQQQQNVFICCVFDTAYY